MKTYLNNTPDVDLHIDLFDELPLWSAPFGLKLLDHIKYKPGITALDIGFGNGFPLTEIAMRLGEESVVYGIDPWKKAIERVQRKIHFYGITNIRIIEGLAENIPLADASIELITSNNGINNVTDIGKVITECSRVLKDKGQFVQTMNLEDSMIEFYSIFEDVLHGMSMNKEVELMHRHIAHKRPPVDLIKSYLESSRFRIKEIISDKFSYRFVSGTAMLNHYFIRLAFMGAWVDLLPADRVEPVFSEIELRMNRKAKDEGGFCLTIPFVLINSVRKKD